MNVQAKADDSIASHLQSKYEASISASCRDNLTGLFSHGFFSLLLQERMRDRQTNGTPFVLALIDIDSFRIYNDCYGHLKGDRLLRKVAELVMANLNGSDTAARFGGDVISLILPGYEPDAARLALETIRHEIRQLPGENVTVSIGGAFYTGEISDCDEFIGKARDALICAKTRGKNRVHLSLQGSEVRNDSRAKILIVDDTPFVRRMMEDLLVSMNYDVITSATGRGALSIVEKIDVDLIVLDVMMPGMDGFEVCRRLKGNESTRMIPVIILTALEDREAKIKGIEAGADDFVTKPPNELELTTRIRSLVNVKYLNNNLASIENVLISLAHAVEAKDAYTEGHVRRVADLGVCIGREMQLPEKMLKAVWIGGILHDIGKIGIPGKVLNKPGPLTPGEWDIIKKHPEAGYHICLPLKKSLGEGLDIIRYHHCKLDGSGYPGNLKGDQISIPARIMVVADMYDALSTDRPYRRALPQRKAFDILRQEADEGKLDAEVVHRLISLAGSFEDGMVGR